MDLYTASRRVSTAFQLPDGPLDTGRYGVIGDGFSAAFIGVDGSVDWLCWPRFDSPSVFAALLDREQGGFFRICPLEEGFESLQAYDDSTNVIQTLFRRADRGTVVLTDFMPWNGDPRFSVYELALSSEAPNPRFLNTEGDLGAFRAAHSDAVRAIVAGHEGLERIHVFPAVPAPIAVSMGWELLPKRDPSLLIFDSI